MKQLGFRPVLAGIALAIASVTTIVVAAPAPAAGSADQGTVQPDAKHRGHGHYGMHHHTLRGAMMIPGLGPLGKKQVDALKLTADQQTKFQAAQDAQTSLHGKIREAHAARQKAVADQVAAGKLDPHALADQSSQSREQFKADAEKVRNAWFGVWDSLSDAQRSQVTGFVKAHQERMAQRHEQHRGAHHKAGQQPAPAAPAPAPANPA